MKTALTLNRALSLWEASLGAQGKERITIKGYVRHVEFIEDELGRDADPATITVEDLEGVVAGWDVSRTTTQNRIVAWRQFFRWGRKRYGWPDPTDGLELPRKDQPALRRLRPDEVIAMLEADAPRIDRTAIYLFAFLGIRRAELMRLRWDDVDLIAGSVRVFGKGRKGREIPLHEQLVNHLVVEKAERGPDAAPDCYVFPRRDGYQFVAEESLVHWYEPASDNAVDRCVKRVAEAAGVHNPNGVTSHMFRRFLLERLLEDGVSPYIAARIAGHASIDTTAHYGGGASFAAAAGAIASTPLVPVSSISLAEPVVELAGIEPASEPDSPSTVVGPEPESARTAGS